MAETECVDTCAGPHKKHSPGVPDICECARCNYGACRGGRRITKIRAAMAPGISSKSWLQEDRFEGFRAAYGYASTQTHAIRAMAKLSPEEAYHLFEALKRGEQLHSKA